MLSEDAIPCWTRGPHVKAVRREILFLGIRVKTQSLDAATRARINLWEEC